MLEGATALLERQDKSADSLTTKVVGNHKNKTPSEGMGFCFWNAAGRFELTASTCAKRVKSRGEGKAPANGSAIRGMPGSEFELRLFCCAEREK